MSQNHVSVSKIMWFLHRDSCEGYYPKICDISLSNNIQMIWVAFSKTVWSFECKEIVHIMAYLKIAKKTKIMQNKTSRSDSRSSY